MSGHSAFTLLIALALGLAACAREEILSVDAEEAPGESAPTVEVLLGPADLLDWNDTVFAGFVGPSNASFLLVEEGSATLTSRGLLRFESIQDSVSIGGEVSTALRFDSARVVFGVDSLRTALSGGGTTLQLRGVEQAWDGRSADWEFAVDTAGTSVPWSAGPGGSLGDVLSEVTLTELVDTVEFELGAASDSLIRLWADTAQVNTGVALVVADTGRVALSLPQLHYNLVPESQPDTAVQLIAFATAGTYLFDGPGVGISAGVLRLGGIDGWRSYVELLLPDSATPSGSGSRQFLRGATVNKAELVLASLPPPSTPLAAEQAFFISAFEVAGDFLSFGPKTPVGSLIVTSLKNIDPDSLASGTAFAIDLTQELQEWAAVPADSAAPPIRIAIRAVNEGANFGFWEFGAADGELAFRPTLRVIFTRPTDFVLP